VSWSGKAHCQVTDITPLGTVDGMEVLRAFEIEGILQG
jgi:hypothetical protein